MSGPTPAPDANLTAAPRANPTQAPSAAVLIRPHHFRPNPATAIDNAFQTTGLGLRRDVSAAAYHASTAAARRLTEAGVAVHLFDDETAEHPDSVFPNNWFSTHNDGRIALYPMYAQNRRGERRPDVIEFLKFAYRVEEVTDYSGLELDGIHLEGTGAMVLDHTSRIAYTARSRRADPKLLHRFCTAFGYEPMMFDARDEEGTPVYHTNVMMCVATDFALVCLDAIADVKLRSEVVGRLRETGKTVVALTQAQVRAFAGNAIELRGSSSRRLLALSTTAAAALTPDQVEVVESSCDLLALDVSPIELAGGSIRCMIAGIHLDPRTDPVAAPAPRSAADDVVMIAS